MNRRKLTTMVLLIAIFISAEIALGEDECPIASEICTTSHIQACIKQMSVGRDVEKTEVIRRRLADCTLASSHKILVNIMTTGFSDGVYGDANEIPELRENSASIIIDISKKKGAVDTAIVDLLEANSNDKEERDLRSNVINKLRLEKLFEAEYYRVIIEIFSEPDRGEEERISAAKYFAADNFVNRDAQESINDLLVDSNDKTIYLRRELINLLSGRSTYSLFALEPLTKLMISGISPLNEDSAKAVHAITLNVLFGSEDSAIQQLEKANDIATTYTGTNLHIEKAKSSLKQTLSRKRKDQFLSTLMENIPDSPWLYTIPAYIVWFTFVMMMYWKAPIKILSTAKYFEFLSTTVGGKLGGTIKSVESLFLIPFLKNRPRVLDAWVLAHFEQVQQQIYNKTHQCRYIYKKQLPELSNTELRILFSGKKKATVWIWGEPASGKTCLAYQIALCAMNDKSDHRLYKHLCIPIVFSEEINAGADKPLFNAISNRLNNLANDTSELKMDFIKALLKQRRVLVIVDWFKVLDQSHRTLIEPDSQGCSIAAMVVVSESNKGIDDFTLTSINTHLVERDDFQVFVTNYLQEAGREDLIDNTEIEKLVQNFEAIAIDNRATNASVVELVRRYINEKDKLTTNKSYGKAGQRIKAG